MHMMLFILLHLLHMHTKMLVLTMPFLAQCGARVTANQTNVYGLLDYQTWLGPHSGVPSRCKLGAGEGE